MDDIKQRLLDFHTERRDTIKGHLDEMRRMMIDDATRTALAHDPAASADAIAADFDAEIAAMPGNDAPSYLQTTQGCMRDNHTFHAAAVEFLSSLGTAV